MPAATNHTENSNIKVWMERFLIVFVVCIFTLSALQSSTLLYEELNEVGARYGTNHSEAGMDLQNLNNVRTSFYAWALGLEGIASETLEQELNYFAESVRKDFKNLSGKAPDIFGEKSAAFDRAVSDLFTLIQKRPQSAEEKRALFRALYALENTVSEIWRARFDVQEKQRIAHLHEEHQFLFHSIISMMISGLGLLFLLLVKLDRLGKLNREKRKIMSLLEPRAAALESARDGMAITNGNGVLRYVNMALAAQYGCESSDELIDRHWSVLYPLKQAEWMTHDAFKALKEEGYWVGHLIGKRKNGEEFYQDASITALKDGGYVFVLRDFSEMQEYMQLAEMRLAAIEAAGDGIGIVDKNGRIAYINKALRELHGLEEDETDDMLGQPWEKLYNEKGRQDIRRSVLPALYSEGSWKGISPIARRDGSAVQAEMTLTLLPDGGFIGTARDISDRIRAEKEKDDLQKQFYQAQKMEAIGRMAGGIAHDFNNILASMLGYTEFLLEDLGPDSRQHDFAHKIMLGGYQARHLVDQILTFSRRNESAMDNINIVDILHETAGMMRATMEASVDLDIKIDIQSAYICANVTQISQTLMNLLVNARDSLEGDRGTIYISAQLYRDGNRPDDMLFSESEPVEKGQALPVRITDMDGDRTRLTVGTLDQDKDYICVSVADNGMGMPREVMEHIFEPFFTTKDIGKGTGLGLSSAHGIIASHQGAITVVSVPGGGTRFDLYFPLTEAAAEASEALAADDGAEKGGAERILVVEDEDRVREMMVERLERQGYKARACADGFSAIDLLREKPGYYQLVITDMGMPGMSGAEMAKEIYGDFPDLPVLVVSGYRKQKLESLTATVPSIKGVLKKPLESDALFRHIREVLGSKEAA